MPTTCDRCRAQGPRPALPAGTGGNLYKACPRYAEFHTRLYQAVSTGQELVDIGQKLGFNKGDFFPVIPEPARDTWPRLLELTAKVGKLPELAKLAAEGPGKAAYQLETLVREASCGFIDYQPELAPGATIGPSLPRTQSAYLMCDRANEWQAFAVERERNAIVPLIALGPEEEALDLLLRRIERFLDKYSVVTVKWESDYPAANRYAALQLALRQVLTTQAPANAEVPELLRCTSQTVLLHPLYLLRREAPESDLGERYLIEYYERLARDLSRLSPEYPAPYVVQCISWEGNEQDRARALAEEIAKRLATVEPKPHVIQHAVKPILNDDVKSFLDTYGKISLWPKVSRDIHRINWPVPMGRKSSRAVFDALFNAFSNDSAGSRK